MQDKSVALKALGSLEAIPVTFEHLLAGSDVVETVKKVRLLVPGRHAGLIYAQIRKFKDDEIAAKAQALYAKWKVSVVVHVSECVTRTRVCVVRASQPQRSRQPANPYLPSESNGLCGDYHVTAHGLGECTLADNERNALQSRQSRKQGNKLRVTQAVGR